MRDTPLAIVIIKEIQESQKRDSSHKNKRIVQIRKSGNLVDSQEKRKESGL